MHAGHGLGARKNKKRANSYVNQPLTRRRHGKKQRFPPIHASPSLVNDTFSTPRPDRKRNCAIPSNDVSIWTSLVAYDNFKQTPWTFWAVLGLTDRLWHFSKPTKHVWLSAAIKFLSDYKAFWASIRLFQRLKAFHRPFMQLPVLFERPYSFLSIKNQNQNVDTAFWAAMGLFERP